MAEPTSEPLTDYEIERLADSLDAWVMRHPYPDHPAFSFGASRPFSPRELAIAIREGGDIRELFLRMVRFATEEESIEAIIAGFYGARR